MIDPGWIYLAGFALTAYIGVLMKCGDEVSWQTICGRALLWPLFAIKLVCRVLLAGWEDLFA